MSSRPKPRLRVDWADAKAARHACKNWHYSKSVPPGTSVIVGAWEDDRFLGVVMFARGASPYLGQPLGLSQTECVELVRIALREHRSPVTQIVRHALKLLKKRCPGVRVCVSFADPNNGHHGGIYQGGNWIFTGCSPSSYAFVDKQGRWWHQRQVTATGISREFGAFKRCAKRSEVKRVRLLGKYRYLYPLDDEMRAKLAPLAKPYPKRQSATFRVESADSGTSAIQAEGDGAEPISTLH